MSDNPPPFMTLALNGEVLPEEIDDFVAQWHSSDTRSELSEWLGMTEQEYSLWFSEPDMINIIIAARHRHQPLLQAVNDNINTINKIAARADKPWKVTLLQAWINKQLGN